MITLNKKTQPEKSLRQRALEYLGKREYSYKELGHKLIPYLTEHETEDSITEILDDFKARGWLSDTRFTDQLVHVRRVKFGSSKIAQELREKGVSNDLVSDALDKLKESDLTAATEVWRKKYKVSATDKNERAKQARFLQSRGFDFDIIKKVLNAKYDD